MFPDMVTGMCWFFGSIVLIRGLGGLYNDVNQAFESVIWGVIFIAIGYFVNKWNTKFKI